MSAVSHTLNEFGKSLGLDGLAFPEPSVNGGAISLNIENMGTLFMEQSQQNQQGSRAEDEVLIYLARPIPPFTEDALQTALQLCHFEQGHPFVVQAGLKGEDMLIFLVRIPEHEFTLPVIDRSLSLLEHLHNSVASQ